MFDFVRQHNRIMQFLLFLLIFPSFVLFGLEGYSRFKDQGQVVASVDGQDITQAEWDNAHRQQVERLRAAMPTADVKLFDSPEARQSSLESLVRERVWQRAANQLKLTVSDQRLAAQLQQDANIAGLRRPDGSLDTERYRQLLGAQGMTPEMFEARVRAEMASRQVTAGVAQGSFAPASLANVSLDAFYERREVRVARFDAGDFAAQIKPTDEALQAYYQAHSAQFASPERADVEYVVLDLAAIQKSVVVPESELRSFYEQNQSRLAALEERRASHILLAADKSAPAAERAKAQAQAEDLLAQLRKSPEKFAELARKHSQDPGSAAKGGDLDFFARGAMVKPFEEAVFQLKKGETSGVVETDFGFHIIRLTDVRTPKAKSFEESRASLEADARRQLAQRKFAEAADTFTNTVYEQSDSLKPVADKLKLEVQRAQGLTRDAQPGTVPAVLGNPKVLAAIFAADTLDKQRNTEAVEVGPSQLVAARVVKHTPASTLPLEQVKAQVRERVVAEQAAQRAQQEGQQRLQAWKAQPDQARLGALQTVSREDKTNLPTSVVEAALRASSQSLPAWVGVDLGNRGYAVVKVEKVLPRDAQATPERRREREQYAQWWATAETLAYYQHLKQQLKVQVKTPPL